MATINDRIEKPDLKIIAGTKMARSGSAIAGTQDPYSSRGDDSNLGQDALIESPVSPVGVETRGEKHVDEVIARLSGSKPLPPSFSEEDLYRTAARVGVKVWQVETKTRFRDRVLERLNYRWDSDLELFVPIIGDDLIDAIKTAAETITPALQEGLHSELQSRVDEWCAERGFDRLDEPETVTARYAVFNYLLQATVYEQYHRRGELPALDTDIQHAFQLANERTGESTFDPCVLDDIAVRAEVHELTTVVEMRHRLVVSEHPSEDIGGLFEALTPKESRQRLGQFRTPQDLGMVMRAWATTEDTRLLDPGMGACALSAPSFTSWVTSSDPTHVTGIDRSHLGVSLGTAVMSIHDQSRTCLETDFLDASPADVDGAIDAIVSNPPYSRTQELSDEYTEKINRLVRQETGLNLSGNAPLYSHFIMHAAQFLSTGDRAVFLTPNFLDKEYGESLKEFLLAEFDVKALLLFNPAEISVFDEAETTALISFLERCTDDEGGEEETRLIQVDDMPEKNEMRRAVNGSVDDDAEWGSVTTINQSTLEFEQNWRGLFNPTSINTEHLIPLSEIASVSRGILTGMNTVFCLPQSEVEAYGLPESCLSPLIQNASSVPHFDYRSEDWDRQRAADDDVWILYHLTDIDVPNAAGDYASAATAHPSDNALGSDTVSSDEIQQLLTYLEHGLQASVTPPNRTFDDRGDSWFLVDRRDPPPILVTTVNRDRCRFILNETDARNLNNLHGVFPDITLSDCELKALLAYLNSNVVNEILRNHERLHADGMRKLEPGDVEDIPVLDPRDLSADTVAALADAFDTLRETARRDETIQPVIATIDERVKREF